MNINKLKKIFTIPYFDKTLSHLTQNKGYDNFFVKILPSNLDYSANTIRRKSINEITYDLHLNEWMEYALYFGIRSENKDVLYSMIKPGMTVFDVGANFGETVLNFAKLLGSQGKVYAFEPMPYVYEKCRHNISLNKFSNITLELMALSNVEEKLAVNDPLNGNSGGIYTSKLRDTAVNKLVIQADTLDNYFLKNNVKAIDFLKIDVEGFEMNVLKGARQSLAMFNPIIYLEICDVNLKRAGSSSVEIVQFLNDLGYKIKQIHTGEKITVDNISTYIHTDIVAKVN